MSWNPDLYSDPEPTPAAPKPLTVRKLSQREKRERHAPPKPAPNLTRLLLLAEMFADKYASTKQRRWGDDCREVDYHLYLELKSLLQEMQS